MPNGLERRRATDLPAKADPQWPPQPPELYVRLGLGEGARLPASGPLVVVLVCANWQKQAREVALAILRTWRRDLSPVAGASSETRRPSGMAAGPGGDERWLRRGHAVARLAEGPDKVASALAWAAARGAPAVLVRSPAGSRRRGGGGARAPEAVQLELQITPPIHPRSMRSNGERAATPDDRLRVDQAVTRGSSRDVLSSAISTRFDEPHRRKE